MFPHNLTFQRDFKNSARIRLGDQCVPVGQPLAMATVGAKKQIIVFIDPNFFRTGRVDFRIAVMPPWRSNPSGDWPLS